MDRLFYRVLIARQLISVSSTFFYVYFIWITYSVYHSVLLTGLVPSFSLLGYLIIAYPEGIILDRFSRNIVLVFSSLSMACTFLILLVSRSLPIIYAVALTSGILTVMAADCMYSITKEVVTEHELSKAMSFMEVGRSLSSITGIVMGGLSAAFLANDGLYILILLSCIAVVSSFPPRPFFQVRNTRIHVVGGRNIIGIIYRIMPLILLGMLVNAAFIALDVFSAPLVSLYLHKGALFYTILLTSFGAGSLTIGLISIRLNGRLKNAIISISAMSFIGLTYLVLSVVRSSWVITIFAFLMGGSIAAFIIPVNAQFTKIIPNEIFGRVNSLTNILMGGSSPVLAALYSFLGQEFSPEIVLFFLGITVMFMTPFGFLQIRKFYAMKGELPVENITS